MEEFSFETINSLILTKQHLTPNSKTDDIIQITTDLCGLHSTSQSTPYLSLFARSNNFKKETLDEVAFEKKLMGKIRCMRKTVFIHPKETIPFYFNATKQQYAKRHVDYLKNLGVSEEEYQKNVKDIIEVLEKKALSVSQIKKELGTDVNVSAMVNLACDQTLIIRNKPIKSWRDKRHTYSVFTNYFPDLDLDEVSEENGIKYMIRNYLHTYGPVTENDIVWWTGMNKTPVRSVIEELEKEISKIFINETEKEYYILNSDLKQLEEIKIPKKDVLNFLPDLDPYLMGYKDRERYIGEDHYNYLFDRSGNAATSILVNGKVIGIWDFVSAKEPVIKMYFLEEIKKDVQKEIKKEANKVGQFIFDTEAELLECDKMEPLKGRIPGEVLVPLKHC